MLKKEYGVGNACRCGAQVPRSTLGSDRAVDPQRLAAHTGDRIAFDDVTLVVLKRQEVSTRAYLFGHALRFVK